MYDLLKEFLKPEILVLVPVLYLLGCALKKSAVPDKNIPWILGAAGVILTYIWVVATTEIYGISGAALAVFTSIVQGVLAAGASVYVNQVVKQRGKEE